MYNLAELYNSYTNLGTKFGKLDTTLIQVSFAQVSLKNGICPKEMDQKYNPQKTHNDNICEQDRVPTKR